jgi:hypothetical protein
MLADLQIVDWDLCLVGDGSGNSWKNGCGWACVLVDRVSQWQSPFFGGMSAGSISLAEFMPYFQALSFYHHEFGRERLKFRGRLQVHVITDSQVISQHGNQVADPRNALPKTQQAMWAGMREFGTMGYEFHYHWARRSTSVLNKYVDLLSVMGRKSMQELTSPTLSLHQRMQIRRVAQIGQLALDNDQADLRAMAGQLLEALQLACSAIGLAPSRAAQQIEGIKLTDPASGQEITLAELNPLEPPAAHD